MHWVIQENLYKERGFVALMDCMERFNIPHTVVKVVPFSIDAPDDEQLIPNPKLDGLVMVCGSTTLGKIARKRGWIPGSFENENHNYEVWKKHYGEHLLNFDSKVCRFADIPPQKEDFFCRPTLDSKTFSGKVTSYEEYIEWRDRVLSVGSYTTLDADTLITYGPTKIIYYENRFFVVDGEIVGKSLYKRGDRVVYDENVDDDAVEHIKKMIAIWQPARAFVIDNCFTPDGYKIVEINTINSAGFYNIDIPSFVMAIENMKF